MAFKVELVIAVPHHYHIPSNKVGRVVVRVIVRSELRFVRSKKTALCHSLLVMRYVTSPSRFSIQTFPEGRLGDLFCIRRDAISAIL